MPWAWRASWKWPRRPPGLPWLPEFGAIAPQPRAPAPPARGPHTHLTQRWKPPPWPPPLDPCTAAMVRRSGSRACRARRAWPPREARHSCLQTNTETHEPRTAHHPGDGFLLSHFLPLLAILANGSLVQNYIRKEKGRTCHFDTRAIHNMICNISEILRVAYYNIQSTITSSGGNDNVSYFPGFFFLLPSKLLPLFKLLVIPLPIFIFPSLLFIWFILFVFVLSPL